MIIVSQKNKIINYDNIVEISIKDLTIYDYECFGIIAKTVNNKEKELGTYATEERAKEVLQEIIKAYIEDKKCKEGQNIFGYSIIPSNTYYEMPKE